MNNSVDLDERGKRLRRDVEQLYSGLQGSNSLRARPHTNDITEFMSQYIHEGISFDDAERILRSAGLTVLDRPDVNAPGGGVERYDVVATVLLPARPWSRVDLFVNLRPKAPGDYSAVKVMRADIILTYL